MGSVSAQDMGQRGQDAAVPLPRLMEVARPERASLQAAKDPRVHLRSDGFHEVESHRRTSLLIRVKHAETRIETHRG
jgi:hypothetical protein